MLRSVRLTLQMIKWEHTIFAMPFAFIGLLVASLSGPVVAMGPTHRKNMILNDRLRGLREYSECMVAFGAPLLISCLLAGRKQ